MRPFVKPKKASEPSGDLLLIGALILVRVLPRRQLRASCGCPRVLTRATIMGPM